MQPSEGPALLRGYSARRVVLALLLPFPAAVLQWFVFPYIYSSVWILFYPVLFLSGWLAGLIGGVGSAIISTFLVYGIFIGPPDGWVIGANRILPTVMFLAMGLFFGEVHERLHRARRQLAEERNTTEAKFEGLVEQSLAGIYVAENGLITYANPEFARIFGYQEPESLIGRPSTELVTTGYGGKLDGEGEAWRDRRGLRGELIGLRQDGSVVPVDVHGRTIEVDGQHMAIGVVIDRTEMREAKDTIRQRDELLDRTSEIGKIGGWEFNVLTGETMWTPEAARIHGLRPDQAEQLDQARGRWTAPEWLATYREAFRQVGTDGKPMDFESQIVTAAGEKKWVRVVGRPVMIGSQVLRVQGTVQDVSDRHEAQEALRRSEERFRTLVEQMPDGMVVFDPDGWVIDVNAAACAMMGYSANELRARNVRDLVATKQANEVVKRIAEGVDPKRASEWVLLRKDGSELHAEAVGRGLPSGDVQVVVRDVTERRNAEQLIRELNSELERKVAFRTAEVVAANRELEAFSYAVSHDLRAPLRAMSGFCKALEEDYGGSLDATAHEYIEYIIEGSRAMGDLIDALLTLSRDTRGDMLHEDVDITDLAEKAVVQRRQFYPEREVDVEIEPGMHVFGDARMVRVLVNNLVSNAWKYTMKTEGARISVSSESDEAGRTWIRIADNGAGFNTRYASQLFEPFHRLHREDDFPGIGIGLATVKRIVNRHGGEIRASAAVGEGATFSFRLPAPDDLLAEGI